MSNATPPSGRTRTWKALAIAAVVAVILLFTVVLPAEYGYDPTRIGRALGLTSLSEAQQTRDPTIDELIADVIGGNDDIAVPADGGSFNDPIPLPNPAVSQVEGTAPKTETLTVRLDFDGRTEVKAKMKQAKAIVYSWKVEGGEVYVDFHGHDPAKGKNFWVRYDEADGITERSGSLVAPFDGEHGWYWLNASQEPITIHLTVTGYFDELVTYGLSPPPEAG